MDAGRIQHGGWHYAEKGVSKTVNLAPGSQRSHERVLSIVREEALRDRLIARDERALVELVDVATP